MNYYIFDKNDEILNRHDKNAVNVLSLFDGGYCIGMLNEHTNENVGFCYLSMAPDTDIMQLDRLDIADEYRSEENECSIIEAAERFAKSRGAKGLRIKYELPEDYGEDMSGLRLRDAAELLSYGFSGEKEYLEFTLESLLKGRLIRGVLSTPDKFPDVFLLQEHENEALIELEKICLEKGIAFSAADFDEELTVFCSSDGNRPDGVCCCRPHADGILYIDDAYLEKEGDTDPIRLSLLAAVILQLSQYYLTDTRVRISLSDAGLRNRSLPMLGEMSRYVTEGYLEKHTIYS
ncbi:MAG: hypothetical protein MJ131_04610 [Lachnospiraceae bacterium]|nr:hypothetical protein [Lachnospiraceae bacterium]